MVRRHKFNRDSLSSKGPCVVTQTLSCNSNEDSNGFNDESLSSFLAQAHAAAQQEAQRLAELDANIFSTILTEGVAGGGRRLMS